MTPVKTIEVLVKKVKAAEEAAKVKGKAAEKLLNAKVKAARELGKTAEELKSSQLLKMR
jgi:hypothetical protein